MAIIYLVRHGQTEHNANDIIQGQINSPLTPLGLEQAEISAERLKDIDFTTCYHSPLGRTTQTAQVILKYHDIPTFPCPELMEINMGVLEGEINDHTVHGEEFENFTLYPHKYTVPVKDAETYQQLTQRVYNCCQNIADNHGADEKILIVSHGGPLRSLLNPLIDKPLDGFWFNPDIPPASISIVRWEKAGKPQLISFAGTPAAEMKYDPTEPHGFIRPN